MIRYVMLVLFLGGAFAVAKMPARSLLKAPEFQVKSSMGEGSKLVVRILPPAEHHFNIQAPHLLELASSKTKMKAQKETESQIDFQFADSSPKQFLISAYLCDDKKTFCEKHTVKVNWDGKSISAEPVLPASLPPQDSASVEVKGTAGFILNSPDEALARAKLEKKPLMIDFFGIWCPPCNELDDQVFSSEEFQKAGQDFIKLKLDADSDVSWALKSKYKVSGYPTIVFASEDGEEISRISGFRGRDEFVQEMKKAWKSRTEPYSVLKAKADQGNREASDKLGLMSLDRKEYELARKYLTATRAHREQLTDAELGILEQAADQAASPVNQRIYLERLEKAVQEFPASPDSLQRREKLAELYEGQKQPEKQKSELEAIVALAQRLAANPGALRGHDMNPGDALSSAAQAEEKMGRPAQAREIWKKAAQWYRQQVTSDIDRGDQLELAYCLRKAGETGAASELYRKLEARYPQEFTFYFGHASMDFELKSLEEARSLATKALDYSYGDNKLRVTQLLAKILKEQGKSGEGKALIEKTLSSVTLPKDSSIRTFRYVKALRDLQKQLSQGG